MNLNDLLILCPICKKPYKAKDFRTVYIYDPNVEVKREASPCFTACRTCLYNEFEKFKQNIEEN